MKNIILILLFAPLFVYGQHKIKVSKKSMQNFSQPTYAPKFIKDTYWKVEIKATGPYNIIMLRKTNYKNGTYVMHFLKDIGYKNGFGDSVFTHLCEFIVNTSNMKFKIKGTYDFPFMPQSDTVENGEKKVYLLEATLGPSFSFNDYELNDKERHFVNKLFRSQYTANDYDGKSFTLNEIGSSGGDSYAN